MESIAVLLIFVIRFDWTISVIVCIGVSLYVAATRSVTVQRKKFRLRSNRQDNQYHQIANNSVSNFEVVKSCATERYETKRYTDSVNEYQLSLQKIQSATVFLRVVQAAIVNTTLLCNLLVTFRSLAQGTSTVGDFVAVSAYTLSVFSPLNTLGGILNSIVQSLADVDNLISLLAVVPEIQDSDGAIPLPIHKNRFSKDLGPTAGLSVQFEDVSFRYPDQPPEHGLQKISFYLPAGTTTAIVGPTGSGKTSISRLLFRFYDPQGGVIRVGDCDIRECTQESLRRCIGIVPQDTALFNDSILYNIRYARQDAPFSEVQEAAELAQIKTFIDGLPEQWETQVGERGLRLSGGEKQRVAIARCLLQDPPVVILDEATAALDTVTEKNIQEALTTLGNNRTVLVIAHRLTTIKQADNIIVLENGKIAESGTHHELLDKGGIYANMWSQNEDSPSAVGASDLSARERK